MCGVIGVGSKDDEEKNGCCSQENLNRKVDVDVGCIFEYYLILLRKRVSYCNSHSFARAC